MKKRIAIMTTGGDCSGLNGVIRQLITIGCARGHEMLGILDGDVGLARGRADDIIPLVPDTIPPELARLSGSFLKNGHQGADYPSLENLAAAIQKSVKKLKLDALINIGGNGSFSILGKLRASLGNLQLIGIPKTIDMDLPGTDDTIGFGTAVNQLATYCDQLLLTARSHHRWFVVQTMGRDVGHLALSAGIATGADAILIPEIRFSPATLIAHIKQVGRDYGIILVAEGIKLRGHSGAPGEMIGRELTRAGIANRVEIPEHIQRTGDTIASDRILAARFAECAMNAIDAGESDVITASQNGKIRTIPFAQMLSSGMCVRDPHVGGVMVATEYVELGNPLLRTANELGIYVGEIK